MNRPVGIGNKFWLAPVLLGVVLLLLMGCSEEFGPMVSEAPATTDTPISQQDIPSPTLTPKLTSTSLPTNTPVSAPTLKPTPTRAPTPVLTPTVAPSPTLTPTATPSPTATPRSPLPTLTTPTTSLVDDRGPNLNAYDLQDDGWLRSNMPSRERKIREVPWVQDGIGIPEMGAVQGLIYLGRYGGNFFLDVMDWP